MRADARTALWVTVACALAAAELAINGGPQAPLVSLAKTGLLTALIWIVGTAIVPWAARRRVPWWLAVVWLAAAALPVVLDGGRAFAPHGDPLSLRPMMIAAMRNVMLVGALFAAWRGPARIAAGTSVFVVLLGISFGEGAASVVAVAAYVVAGAVWLMVQHWGEITMSAVAAPSRRLPAAPAVLAGLALLTIFTTALFCYPSRQDGVSELLSRWFDVPLGPTGRAAIALAARNQQAVEQLANEKYGHAPPEAAKSPGSTASVDALMTAMGKDAGRERRGSLTFSVIRQRDGSHTGTLDRRVLFEMEKDLLRHVPVITYSQFDGLQWRSDAPQMAMRQTAEINEPSMWVTKIDPLALAIDPESGAMSGSVGSADENRDAIDAARSVTAQWMGNAPALTPQLSSMDLRLLANLLKRPAGHTVDPTWMLTPYDLGWAQEQLRSNPELAAAVHRMLESREGQGILRGLVESRLRRQQAVLPPGVRSLLNQWITGKSSGWPQIRAIVDGVRAQAVHDPEAAIPPEADDPLTHFLLRSRRGPDYLFASATAILLRSAGYPSRLAGGFYADPARRSWLTGRVAVRGSDVHYWAQTRLENGLWVDLEPTPGYVLPGGVAAQAHSLAAAWQRWTAAAREYRVWLGAAGVTGLLVFITRRQLSDLVRTALWRLRMGDDPTRAVVATWRLIEWRARTAGRGRPPGKTLAQWYPPLLVATEQLRILAAWADQAAFRPAGLGTQAGPSPDQVRRLCREAVQACSIRSLTQQQKKKVTRPRPKPRAVLRPVVASAARPAWLATRFRSSGAALNIISTNRPPLPDELAHDHDRLADGAAVGAAG